MHNRESAEASSPELARAPLPASARFGSFPSLIPGPSPSPPSNPPLSLALISTPSWPGVREVLRCVPDRGGRLRARGAAEHRSRGPGPRHCPAGAPRGALPRPPEGGDAGGGSGERRGDSFSELLVAWPLFRAGGLILPAGTTQPRRLVAKGAGGEGWRSALLRRPGRPPQLRAGLAARTGPKSLRSGHAGGAGQVAGAHRG